MMDEESREDYVEQIIENDCEIRKLMERQDQIAECLKERMRDGNMPQKDIEIVDEMTDMFYELNVEIQTTICRKYDLPCRMGMQKPCLRMQVQNLKKNITDD